MAFGTPRQVLADGVRVQRSPRPGLFVDLRRPSEVWFVTKAGGDTTGLVITAAHLKYIREVIVQDAATGAVIAATATGYGSNAVTLSALGANAVGLLITLIGNKDTK